MFARLGATSIQQSATLNGTVEQLTGNYFIAIDEVGRMAGAVQIFRDNMIRADRLAAEQEAERVAKEQRAARLTALVGDFEGKVGGLVRQQASAKTELQATA